MVVTIVSTHAENVKFDACRKCDSVVALFFDVEADVGNTFFVLVTHHFHNFAEFLNADVAILVSIVHCEHHLRHVVVFIFVVCFVFVMGVIIMIVFFRHHHFHHF